MILPYLGQAIRNLFTKPATEKFPLAEAPAAQPHYRGRIAYDPSVCVNCGMCQKVCAPQAISRDIRPLPNGDDRRNKAGGLSGFGNLYKEEAAGAQVHAGTDCGDEGRRRG